MMTVREKKSAGRNGSESDVSAISPTDEHARRHFVPPKGKSSPSLSLSKHIKASRQCLPAVVVVVSIGRIN